MYGQMTAGSWIYIGTQGILQGTYETLADRRRAGTSAAPRRHARRHRRTGRDGWRPAAGRHHERGRGAGRRGGSRSASSAGSTTRYLDERTATTSTRRSTRVRALRPRTGTALSIGLLGNAADVLPELVRRGFTPDVVTDQTSAHDPLERLRAERHAAWPRRRAAAPSATRRVRTPQRSTAMARPRRARCCALQARGAITFDYGNNIRAQAVKAGVADAFDIPGFVPEYIRPLFCEGKGPFRWVALSGDPEDIRGHRPGRARDVSRRRSRCAAGFAWPANGSPSRDCRRASAGSATASAPASACASTNWCAPARSRRRSSSGAIISTPARWRRPTARPRACATAATRSPTGRSSTRCSTPSAGATWVSVHHGGGVGIGYSLHAGMVIVADGSADADEKLRARADLRSRHRRRAPCRRRLSRSDSYSA